MTTLRLGTRRSKLALAQARAYARALARHHAGLELEEVHIVTSGDRVQDRPLSAIGGKGLFIKEIEEALLDGRADFAVHSIKDVPAEIAPGLTIAVVPEREDPRDVVVGATLASLPRGAKVGTSSLRRSTLLHAVRPDLVVVPLRGNVDTRLRKLDDGEVDAIVLAYAGLRRLDLAERATEVLDPATMLPAVGQGALGIECNAARRDLQELLIPLNHAATAWCVLAERSVSRRLAGSCVVPLGAFAEPSAAGVRMRGFVASPDGKQYVGAEETADSFGADPELLGQRVADKLVAGGAHDILSRLGKQQRA